MNPPTETPAKLVLLNPVISLLLNTQTNRWHPILFVEHPLPGPGIPGLQRHKFYGHHTLGFDTREQAEAHVRELADKIQHPRIVLDPPFHWDGTGIPAMIHFFT
jgi:hypothetical protein